MQCTDCRSRAHMMDIRQKLVPINSDCFHACLGPARILRQKSPHGNFISDYRIIAGQLCKTTVVDEHRRWFKNDNICPVWIHGWLFSAPALGSFCLFFLPGWGARNRQMRFSSGRAPNAVVPACSPLVVYTGLYLFLFSNLETTPHVIHCSSANW